MADVKTLGKLFLRGLAAILPLALTGYLVWAAVVGCEQLLKKLLTLFIREENYSPVLGFTVAIAAILLVGLLMYSFVVRTVYARLTALVAKIPVVKSVYGMIVDVVRLFGDQEERPFKQVVIVRHEEGFEQIGFLTREEFADLPEVGSGKVAVYLPMSYQLGGFTMIVPQEKVRRVDMSVEEALRFCVTAGVARKGAAG